MSGPWGVSTQANGRVFLHVLSWDDGDPAFEWNGSPIRSARLLRGEALSVDSSAGRVTILVPPPLRRGPNTIVVLDTAP